MANEKTKKEKKEGGVKLNFTIKKIVTPRLRGQFLHRLFEQDDNDKFGFCAIFDKSEDRSEMKREIARVAKEGLGGLKSSTVTPFRQGTEKQDDYAGFGEDNVFCQLGSYKRPAIRDLHRRPLTEDDFHEGLLKSGDYFKASVYAKPYSHKGKKGVSFVLCSLLFLESGEALFVGGSDPLQDFKDEFVEDADDFDGGGEKDVRQPSRDDMDDLID